MWWLLFPLWGPRLRRGVCGRILCCLGLRIRVRFGSGRLVVRLSRNWPFPFSCVVTLCVLILRGWLTGTVELYDYLDKEMKTLKTKIKLVVKKWPLTMVSGKAKVGLVGKCYGTTKCLMKPTCDAMGMTTSLELDVKTAKKHTFHDCREDSNYALCQTW